MTGISHFPRLLLRERSHSWNLAGTIATSGVTGGSVAQVIRSDGGGFWTCSMSGVSLSGGQNGVQGRERQKLSTLLWRAVREICDGGVNALVVPRNDALFRPWPAGVPFQVNPIPHDDGAIFSDGSGYYQPVIDVRSDGAVSLRATSMNVEILKAASFNGGESFSIFHGGAIGWRLYEISRVFYSDATHANISFRPPLRAAIASGVKLEFDRPCCTMRLTNPGAMDLTVTPWTFNSANAEFIETFPPLSNGGGSDEYVVQDV